MIRISKSKNSAVVPYDAGRVGECRLINSTEAIKLKYCSNPALYDTTGSLTFYEEVYGHKKVSESILKSQRNKCCYCEKNIVDDESVEHFRPKNGFKQAKGQAVTKPGYYWLAYSWENLMYSCTKCNRSKGNLFPLFNPSKRVKNHLKNPKCGMERPMIINPSKENPSPYFRFAGATILPVQSQDSKKRRKAEATIDSIQLNRDTLFQKRASLHNQLLVERSAYYTMYSVQKAKREFKALLKTKIMANQEFSLMIRSIFKNDLK